MEIERGALHGDFRESSYLLIGWLPVSVASFLRLFIQFCFVIEQSPVWYSVQRFGGFSRRSMMIAMPWWEIFLPALGFDFGWDLMLLLRDFHVVSSPFVWELECFLWPGGTNCVPCWCNTCWHLDPRKLTWNPTNGGLEDVFFPSSFKMVIFRPQPLVFGASVRGVSQAVPGCFTKWFSEAERREVRNFSRLTLSASLVLPVFN